MFGLGGWTTFGETITDRKVAGDVIRTAFDAGINFFDIADAYAKGQAETIMGQVLGEFPRHELVISSKVFFPMSDDPNDRGLSRKHIFESIHKSLKRVNTDYLDVYFCHRFDEHTPTEETIRAMDDLVHQGKVLYWGTSEWSGDQLRDAHKLCWQGGYYRPQVEQPQYNLLIRGKFERDTLPTARELGMGLVLYSPLASGLLTGKYDETVPPDSRLARMDWLRDMIYTPERLERVRRFKRFADTAGHPRAVLALAWAARLPEVSSVILGATRVEQLRQNLSALNVQLSSAQLSVLDGLFPVEP